MPDDLQIPIEFTPLDSGTCFQTDAERLEGFSAKQFVTIPGQYVSVVISETTPAALDRDKLWAKIDSNNQLQYTFTWSLAFNLWVALHEVPAVGSERRLWVGTTVDLQTYDGGSVAAVTDVTGPFWEVDTDFADKSVIGVGGAHTPVATDFQIFDDATPGDPKFRTVYIIKRTARTYRTA